MTQYKQFLSELSGSHVTKNNITSDVRCPVCRRYASQHAPVDLTLCQYSEPDVLRIELGKLQHAVTYLFTLSDTDTKSLTQ